VHGAPTTRALVSYRRVSQPSAFTFHLQPSKLPDLPSQRPTGTVSIQCTPAPGIRSRFIFCQFTSRYTTSSPQPSIDSPSQPPSFAQSTHLARRLPHSSPIPIFRKECRLDRLTGFWTPQYVAASIPYRVPLKLAALGFTVVNFLSLGQASPVG
jgi:hypothetical protein